MERREIEIKINLLLEIKSDVEKRLEQLYQELNAKQQDEGKSFDEIISENINLNNVNEHTFSWYLTNVRGLQAHTAKNYIGSLRNLKIKLKKFDNIDLQNEIYNISNYEELNNIEKIIYGSKKIMEINERNHNEITASFNRYKEFLNFIYQGKIDNKVKMYNESFELDE